MLYLWMPEAEGKWHWSRGEHWQQADNLEQLNQDLKLYAGEETTVFFPSRHIQLYQQKLSKAQYKQLGQDGVKYLLEEYVIYSIEQMKVLSHFQAPDQVYVAGISQYTLETFQHALMLLPIKLVALLPDFLILPVPDIGQTVLAQIDGRLLMRRDLYAGQSIDDLALFLEFEGTDRQYVYSGLNTAQYGCLSAALTSAHYQVFDYQFSAHKSLKNHPFNFLPKTKKQSTQSRYWTACIAVLIACLVAQFSYDLVRWVKLKKVADQTSVEAIELYRSWFGQSSRVTEQNLKSQFLSHLRLSETANTQALQLLSRVGPILMQQQIVAEQVNYDANVLNMNLTARSSDVLQGLVQQLNQQGFKAELGNVETRGAGVVGMVKIQ